MPLGHTLCTQAQEDPGTSEARAILAHATQRVMMNSGQLQTCGRQASGGGASAATGSNAGGSKDSKWKNGLYMGV
jgi:hypothetical protein